MSSMAEQVTTHNRNVTCITTIRKQFSGRRGFTYEASHVRGILIAVPEIYVSLQDGDTIYTV